MSKSLLLMLCLLTGLLVLACAKSEETNRNVAAPGGTNSSAPGSTNSSATAADKIGIEECDSFLTAYDNCVSNKVPEATRAQYKNAINTWRTEWKKLADNPQTRGTLATVCKNQMETARAQVKAFGCTL
ncbi:MAG TPA: hypothetical protein VFT48_10025 [Pyrinomonadaceae bacterium]|nr:hypothetical protein [Pyrinomonadaceae bacterium]